MRGNLISYFTEQFSKLIFVRKILLRRPCEACQNLNTDIEDLFSHPWKIYAAYFVFWVEYEKYDVLKGVFSKRVEMKATFTLKSASLGEKDKKKSKRKMGGRIPETLKNL